MENETASSLKIAITLIIISTLISSIIFIVNITRPIVYDKTISIVNYAEEENEKKFEDYNQTIVSGTKVVRLIKECENLRLGVIYQTYEISKNSDYAKNVGAVLDGATTYSTYGSGNLCDESKISDLSSWKWQRKSDNMFYVADYLYKNDDLVICNNYTNAIFSETNKEYIALDGRFLAELVKDTTGKVIGIVFTQQ